MDLAKLCDDRIVEEWTAHAGETGAELHVPTDTGDWERINEIRAEVFLPPDARGEVRCDLDLGTRTEGFDHTDGYWFNALVSPRAGNIWEGWREIRMPAECFYTRGIPGGWSGTRSVRMDVPAGGRIRAVRLVQRQIAKGPRLTDQALLSATGKDSLDEIVGQFRGSGMDRAVSGISLRDGYDREAAEKVLAGNIMGQDWSAGIEWNANPIGYIEWSIRIHGLSYVVPLLQGWRKTGEDRAAAKAESIVVDWIRGNPVPVGVRAGGLAWGHSLVVAMRAFDVLIDALDVLCGRPETKDQTIVDLLKSLWEHAEYLTVFESFPPSNKTIAEGRTLAALGCALPEIAEATRWRDTAFRRLTEDMHIQVMGDGASYELTPGYQLAIAGWFTEALRVARKFGHAVDPALERGVKSMYRWSTALTRPDFSRPSISDAGSLDTKYEERLAEPARFIGETTAVWAGTEGAEGSHPEHGSIGLCDSGYLVMRSGWAPEDRYLLFETAPFGRFHQHEDKLSIDVYAHGTPFIVDPGITSYFPNPWTEYYRTTRAHNTVLVDGAGQNRRDAHSIEQWTQSARDHIVWRSDDRVDVAMGTYDAGYLGVADSVIHRRAVVFVRPDYFIVFDELTGPGSHLYQALFHFMPFRVLVDPDTRAVRTGRMSLPNLEILPLTRMKVEVICGQSDPVQGWVSIGRQDVPAPVAVYSRRSALPIRTGYLLMPFSADRVAAGVSARVTRRGDVWSVRLDHPDGRRDRITMDWSSPQGPELLGSRWAQDVVTQQIRETSTLSSELPGVSSIGVHGEEVPEIVVFLQMGLEDGQLAHPRHGIQ